MRQGLHQYVHRLAKLRADRIGLNATARAAEIDKGQLSRWLTDGDARRELRADAFCRLADSLGIRATKGSENERA